MNTNRKNTVGQYVAKELAIIIPTKDRPEKLRALLESIARQSSKCGRVIIVDSGKSVANIASGFKDLIPVEYYQSDVPGQIRQRNIGISQLTDNDRLVASLDDDLVLEQGALEAMIAGWNRVAGETAGIGFNIVNAGVHTYSPLLGLMLVDSRNPGDVLISGSNIGIHGLEHDIRSRWLGGGYTVWRREILDEYKQTELATRWAHGEDLRFSYPIGKRYPLWVCAGARVRHEHVYDQAPPAHVHRYRGRILSLACFQFVEENREFSRLACCWMILSSAAGRLISGLLKGNGKQLQTAVGQFGAVYTYGKSLIRGQDLHEALAD